MRPSNNYQAKKARSLKLNIKIPHTTAVLGIDDVATAKAAQFHVELARAGAAYADCSLVFQGDGDSEEEDATSMWSYRLHVKTTGKIEVTGTCGNKSVPESHVGDTFVVYALVNGTRVDALSNP